MTYPRLDEWIKPEMYGNQLWDLRIGEGGVLFCFEGLNKNRSSIVCPDFNGAGPRAKISVLFPYDFLRLKPPWANCWRHSRCPTNQMKTVINHTWKDRLLPLSSHLSRLQFQNESCCCLEGLWPFCGKRVSRTSDLGMSSQLFFFRCARGVGYLFDSLQFTIAGWTFFRVPSWHGLSYWKDNQSAVWVEPASCATCNRSVAPSKVGEIEDNYAERGVCLNSDDAGPNETFFSL